MDPEGDLPHIVVVPYAKAKEAPASISVLIFTKEEGVVTAGQPAAWPYSAEISVCVCVYIYVCYVHQGRGCGDSRAVIGLTALCRDFGA